MFKAGYQRKGHTICPLICMETNNIMFVVYTSFCNNLYNYEENL